MHSGLIKAFLLLCLASLANAQEYFVQEYGAEVSMVGADVEYDNVLNTFHIVSAGIFCANGESSMYIHTDDEGMETYRRTICEVDIGKSTALLHDDTLIVGGHNAPVKSHFQVYRINPVTGDSIDHFELPIDTSVFVRQLAQIIAYHDGKYYVGGRGQIADVGMMPLFYVCNRDWSVDTMIVVDTLFDGRIIGFDFTDSEVFVSYDQALLESPRVSNQVIAGFDLSTYRAKYLQVSSEEEWYDGFTANCHLGDGIFFQYLDAEEEHKYLLVDVVNDEVLWEIPQRSVYGWSQYIFVEPRSMLLLSDGNVLVYGWVRDVRPFVGDDRDGPYFCKMDPYSGDVIWDRVIRKDYLPSVDRLQHVSGAILDAVELPSGDLAMTGYLNNPDPILPSKALLIKTDADGCLTPDCDRVIDLDELAVSSQEVEVDKQNIINIYPNPTTDVLTIACSRGSEIRSIEVYDVAGFLIDAKQEIGSTELTLITSGWQPGVYVVRSLTTDGHYSSNKVIVIK